MLAAFSILIAGLAAAAGGGQGRAGQPPAVVTLPGEDGVEAVFEFRNGGYRWMAYRDRQARREWVIAGPHLSLQTPDGQRINLGDVGFARLARADEARPAAVALEKELTQPPVAVRQVFSFSDDGRTLRIQTALRAVGEPVVIQRAGLLEIQIAGQQLERKGPEHVSSPVFGDRIFAGIEHPSAWCQVEGDAMWLAQHCSRRVGKEWADLPAAVFGSASERDAQVFGKQALRRAFLRYLDTVRLRPRDMHIHYNNWWTMPVPFSERDVLDNIAALKQDLYDRTGFFFDSYAMDMGWSDPHSVWDISRERFPEGFTRIREALAPTGCRPGLWVSPSSLYPPALDNAWLRENGYEVTPHDYFGLSACLALGGRYQTAFQQAVLRHAREAHLAHVKFDGFIPRCDAEGHPHPPGAESLQPLAEGLMQVFDSLRAQDPDIALEPTCFGYWPSPWWLMHVPFIIGPFGDDSPRGRCPCPEWIEAMTTARDIANLQGREAFLMPSSALQCFDIIVQCPGDVQNHAAMAIGRGRWFLSTYINPKFMDAHEWRFFADLIRWARVNREFLQEPLPIGGDPAHREPYGYAYFNSRRQLFCVRNPWIEEATIRLPRVEMEGSVRELRTLYPRREVLGRVAVGEDLPAVRLGPYELLFVEVVPTGQPPARKAARLRRPPVEWRLVRDPAFERITYQDERPPYGPSWTSPDGEAPQQLRWSGAMEVELGKVETAELCLLCEGSEEVVGASCSITLDGAEVPAHRSGSAGAFCAAGARGDEENWLWFILPLSPGRHGVQFAVNLPDLATSHPPTTVRCGAFLRGTERGVADTPPFDAQPAFPLYQPERRPWSRTIVPMTTCERGTVAARSLRRRTVEIAGLYLDTLPWREASAGWGKVELNRSVMGKRMMMGGQIFYRGIGTHAYSRIVYDLGGTYTTFAATIGCDQEVQANSIVFVVEGDGQELFRSDLMRIESPPREIAVPIRGVRTLALIVEDGGDGIAADHGNWAEARLMK